jgi:PAS domain S-box-containing protein
MENELSRVVDALPGLVWTARPDGYVDFLNQRWVEYTGLRVDHSYGEGWQAAVHPDDLPRLIDGWRAILASGEPHEIETRLRRVDGAYHGFVFRTCPLADASGQVAKWCGILTDIEDRNRALHTREDHYQSIADSIPALIAFMTPAGEVESVNRHVLEYFGTTLEQLKRWATADSIHPDDLPAVIAAWTRSVGAEEPYDIEHRIRRADGAYRWFHVRGLPLRDSDGRVARWYVLQTDIDDRKRADMLLAGEKRLLEMVVSGHSLPGILDALCRLVESTDSGCYCSVALVDPTGTRLEHGAAPSLPTSFSESIYGLPLNAESGPCAMAAYLNEQVIAADIALETRWQGLECCHLALAHGVKACWSAPISSTGGRVLGVFAIYYTEPRSPTAQDQALIDQFSHIASIAIERAQGQSALKRSEARKAAILDSALDCIVTIDHEGRITEFNPAAERTFGYRRDEVVDRHLADVIIPPSLRESHRQGLARYLATGEARVIGKRIEMTAVRADGSEFPVELAITRIPLDGPPSFTGYLRDITERQQSEEQLRRSEAFLAEGQYLSSTGSFSWSVATDRIAWSHEVYRIYGLDPAMPITMAHFGSRLHPDDIAHVTDHINRARVDGSDFEVDYRAVMDDHSVKYLHAVAHATRDRDGRLEYIGAVQDVTERHVSEEALGKVRSELAHVARVTSLGALTASIAHEVSQPLSGIITNASTCLRMLAAEPPNVSGARETARRTIRDGNRAAEVITRLRALFAKKSAATDAVDLNEATREVIALSLGELQRSRVILRPELADDLPTVAGDRVQLQQVILNLLLNAADAMHGVDDRPRQVVIRTARDDDDRVRVTVQDAGVGVEPQGVEKLFDAFYTTKTGGMGIGLAVSRSIIESHHGRLWAAPNDGPGATFAFSIPRRSDTVPSEYRFADMRTPPATDAAPDMRTS